MDHSLTTSAANLSGVVPEPVSAPQVTAPDPSLPVPAEYDIFCESCGYSLLGLAADRCPECGHAFDPRALPYARVPWLHRRRLGRWATYWETLRMVTFRPREFAHEMCRPVRISAEDARRFRRTTTLVAATALVAAAAAAAILVSSGPWSRQDSFAFRAAMPIGWIAAVVFFYLASDVPVFIWKGLPSLPPHELAPLHHYASAPLGYAPLVAAAGIGLPYLARLAYAPTWAYHLAVSAAVATVFWWVVVCWRTPIALMRAATGCGRRRALTLAFYLPLHVLLMLLVAVLVMMVGMLPVLSYIKH